MQYKNIYLLTHRKTFNKTCINFPGQITEHTRTYVICAEKTFTYLHFNDLREVLLFLQIAQILFTRGVPRTFFPRFHVEVPKRRHIELNTRAIPYLLTATKRNYRGFSGFSIYDLSILNSSVVLFPTDNM